MIGTRLGQYRLDKLLGRGGMGAVYQATDEMLGRQVAVKVLRQDVTGTPDAEERFRTEARILASLDHPHILRLHGFSRHDDVLYMVTEFVPGETLQHMLESGTPVETSEALRWIDEVLDALQYAHHLGVVHRDLKPANVLIDTRGRARLLDFGIAKVAGQDGLTRTGHAVGTLLYMAPEQVMDEPVDGRTDQYAFAVLACELLAGRRPYRSSTTAGLLREIIDGPAPDVAALLPPAAAPAAGPLLRALARRQADRWPSASTMRDALRAAFDTPSSSAVTLHGESSLAGLVPADASAPATVHDASRATPTTAVPAAVARRVWPAAIALAALGVVGLVLLWALVLRPRPLPPSTEAASQDSRAPQSGEPGPTQGVTAAAPLVLPPAPGPMPSITEAPAATTTTPLADSPPRRPERAEAAAVAPATPAPAAPTAPTAPTLDAPAPVAATEAPVPVVAPPVVPAPPPAAAVAPAVFGGIVYTERIDDEDEEFDVSVRLDAVHLVIVDEDDEIKRTIPIAALGQATYFTRPPARFALRRSPSHWVTLNAGATPVVLRLGARTVDGLLSALEARGVRVVRNR